MFYWCKCPGFTCFRRHQPDEIFPMLHFTTMTQSHWHARNYRHFPVRPCCLPQFPLNEFLFSLEWCLEGNMSSSCGWTEVDWWGQNASSNFPSSPRLIGPSASCSGFTGWHYLPVEKFCADCKKNFYLTRLTHFQFSEAALWFWSPAYSRI